MTPSDDSLDDLLVGAACTRLVHRYAWLLDHGGGGDVAELFGTHGRWRAPGTELAGRDAIRAFFASRPPAWLTRHVCSNVTIERTGPDRARGSTYVTVYRSESDDVVPRPETVPGQLSEYVDAFGVEDGRWVILDRQVDVAFRTTGYAVRRA